MFGSDFFHSYTSFLVIIGECMRVADFHSSSGIFRWSRLPKIHCFDFAATTLSRTSQARDFQLQTRLG